MPKGRFLAEFELYVMAAVARLGDDAYGLKIRQEIERRSDRHVAIGAVYATLGRLESKGFLSSRVSDPRPIPGGRSRKHIALTREGRRALDEAITMLAKMLPGLKATKAAPDTR